MNKKPKFIQGVYLPKNKNKYCGNYNNIIYRSSYELKFMHFCDYHNAIIRWSSEETIVMYKNPFDNKYHRYFLDFWIECYSNTYLRQNDYWEQIPQTGNNESILDIIRQNKHTLIHPIFIDTTQPSDSIGTVDSVCVSIDNNVWIKKQGELYKNTNGQCIPKTEKYIVEIKPDVQLRPPKTPQRITKQYENKLKTYLINQAKWEYAEQYAIKNNMHFKIITEKYLSNIR